MPIREKHLILIPGFVGFDALGQLRYYSGVTSLFASWKQQRSDVTLHYFDNFPTASVLSRANRLRRFLAKKIARGEIRTSDQVTLIGHSTGGLDIRQLILSLGDGKPTYVDDRQHVAAADILKPIEKVVFLSVPHYGTNIADYVYSFQKTVMHEIGNLRDALQLNKGPLTRLRGFLASRIDLQRAHILQAIADTLSETDGNVEERAPHGDERKASDAPARDHKQLAAREASEREARYQLLLWLDHMAHDFAAIGDLRSEPTMMSPVASPAGEPTKRTVSTFVKRFLPEEVPDASPAHHDTARRLRELEAWKNLTVRSYATFVDAKAVARTDPFAKLAEALRLVSSTPLGVVFGAYDVFANKLGLSALFASDVFSGLLSLVGLAPVGAFMAAVHAHPPLLFEVIYALCARASGPFQAPDPNVDPTYFAPDNALRVAFGKSEGRTFALDAADNDGIANTLSMFWPRPNGEALRHELFLVEADHADIVGHHSLSPEKGEEVDHRLFASYDLFQSNSGFVAEHFEDVWKDIFTFATKPS